MFWYQIDSIKAISIANRYMNDDASPMHIYASPDFDTPIRTTSKLKLNVRACKIAAAALNDSEEQKNEEQESEGCNLMVTNRTDCFKLAGAIAGRLRLRQQPVTITTKGPIPTLVAAKGICMALQYTQDEISSLSFMSSFIELHERRGPSTALKFILYPVFIS